VGGRGFLVVCGDTHVFVSEQPAGTIIMTDDGGNRFN
jgi:hypothetical protein